MDDAAYSHAMDDATTSYGIHDDAFIIVVGHASYATFGIWNFRQSQRDRLFQQQQQEKSGWKSGTLCVKKLKAGKEDTLVVVIVIVAVVVGTIVIHPGSSFISKDTVSSFIVYLFTHLLVDCRH